MNILNMIASTIPASQRYIHTYIYKAKTDHFGTKYYSLNPILIASLSCRAASSIRHRMEASSCTCRRVGTSMWTSRQEPSFSSSIKPANKTLESISTVSTNSQWMTLKVPLGGPTFYFFTVRCTVVEKFINVYFNWHQ